MVSSRRALHVFAWVRLAAVVVVVAFLIGGGGAIALLAAPRFALVLVDDLEGLVAVLALGDAASPAPSGILGGRLDTVEQAVGRHAVAVDDARGLLVHAAI